MSYREVGINTSFGLPAESASALSGADFYLNRDDIRDFVFDKANTAGKNINFEAVSRLQEHLRELVDFEADYFDRLAQLEFYAENYHQALENKSGELTLAERSAQVTSRLYLSNIEALTALRAFIVDRFWLPKREDSDNPTKMKYLEKRKIYQDDVDDFYNFFNGEVPLSSVDETLIDVANSARLIVNRRDWVGSFTATNSHEFVGSVLSERIVKQSLRDHGFPQARYGTAEEDSKPTRADVVIPIGERALHLQVKMKMAPTEFRTWPDRVPMGVVVPMHLIRGVLTKAEHRHLHRTVTKKVEELAA